MSELVNISINRRRRKQPEPIIAELKENKEIIPADEEEVKSESLVQTEEPLNEEDEEDFVQKPQLTKKSAAAPIIQKKKPEVQRIVRKEAAGFKIRAIEPTTRSTSKGFKLHTESLSNEYDEFLRDEM